MISFLESALMLALTYGLAVLGLAIAFRVLRYPDLTADGSFLLGAAIFSQTMHAGAQWPVALVAASVVGACAGAFTALLYSAAGVNRLLSGILTSMIAYSLAFRVLKTSNRGLSGEGTIFTATKRWIPLEFAGVDVGPVLAAAALAVLVALLLWLLLRSDFGLLLRATGENPSFVEAVARRPARYRAVGLALANGIVGLSGAVVVSRQGFVDVNMGIGVVIILVAALVLGEQAFQALGFDPGERVVARVFAPLVGALLYYVFYLLVLRASILGWVPFAIQPTDLKMLAAFVVIGAVLARSLSAKTEKEELLSF